MSAQSDSADAEVKVPPRLASAWSSCALSRLETELRSSQVSTAVIAQLPLVPLPLQALGFSHVRDKRRAVDTALIAISLAVAHAEPVVRAIARAAQAGHPLLQPCPAQPPSLPLLNAKPPAAPCASDMHASAPPRVLRRAGSWGDAAVAVSEALRDSLPPGLQASSAKLAHLTPRGLAGLLALRDYEAESASENSSILHALCAAVVRAGTPGAGRPLLELAGKATWSMKRSMVLLRASLREDGAPRQG